MPDIPAFETAEDEPLLRLVDERCVKISRNADTGKLEVLMRAGDGDQRGDLVAISVAVALERGIVARADEPLF